ncbi:bifunctional nitrate reductase/sulfite reductase flavoprotein subunit alpha [Erwinia sp. Leaf53]|uniref:bifunctional nitrate reductase/sulfite reductase flavoprotein subunit alpha n=1 Tax=Erwinia sp. Leaf53 TaxID=1736225 RepID=UPI0006F851BF|nr:bifunctional nitrate reductase/sulfite reductase flavoprotein subunit alpha [Erwinia sp. Leaf53]KQN53455.1 reductase [Erwinia sp. Leaf53]
MSNNRTVRSACPYCGVGCGIVMQVEAGCITRVSGDKQHPANAGKLCSKGSSSHLPVSDAGRMQRAWLREDRQREPLPTAMDAAISATAGRLRAILDRDGPDAIALYVSGQMSLEAQYLANKLVKGFIGSQHIESNSRLCMASAGSGYKLSLGSDGPPGSYDDFGLADLFLVTGANMADCHPILFMRMMERVRQGAKLIVVDPRRTATAEKADLHLAIRPGSDLALLNGLLHLLVKNAAVDEAFIAQFTRGWQAMPDFLSDYTPGRVAQITGLAQADIELAARWIGEAAEWMSCWTMGLNQSTHGTWSTNALCNLHLATGKICRPGSGPFSLTGQPNAMGGREMGYMGPGLPGQRSALNAEDRAFVEQQWRLPPGTLRSEGGGGTLALFEQLRAGAIKACWIICSNPVASVPDRDRVIEALQAAELVIAQDAFLDTETNRYADILLPAALHAEAEGVMINSERSLTLMQQAVAPPGEALPDWQIIARVACEMGFADAFSYQSAEQVFDEIRRFHNPATGYDLRGASYARLRQQPLQWPCPPDDPQDRHPLRYLNQGISQTLRMAEDGSTPRLNFATPDGRACFFTRPHQDPAEMPDDDYPFLLNTGRVQHQWHTLTKTGKVATLNKLNPGPFIEVNPQDAARLALKNGDPLSIRSRRGAAVLPVSVSDRVQPGCCFAPFHWNDLYGEQLAINAVTSDAVDPISLQPELKCCAVSLQRVETGINSDTVTKGAASIATFTGSVNTTNAADAANATSTINAAGAASAIRTANAAGVASATRTANAVNTAHAASTANALNTAHAANSVNTIAHHTGGPDMTAIEAFTRLLAVQEMPAPVFAPHEQRWLAGFISGLHNRPQAGVPLMPKHAPLTADNRLWLDGVLAGLFGGRDDDGISGHAALAAADARSVASNAAPAAGITLLYASQTGNAAGLAESFSAQLRDGGLAVALHEMDQAPADCLRAGETLLLLTSTFGDGDAPDNGQQFWQRLQAQDEPLIGLRYAVLALGDSSFDRFCQHGRQLDARLTQLAATPLLPLSECDSDYAQPASAWFNQLLPLLSLHIPAVYTPSVSSVSSAPAVAGAAASSGISSVHAAFTLAASNPALSSASHFSKSQPYPTTLLDNACISAPESAKETRLIRLSLGPLSYQPGDALGVWPRNCPRLVDELLALTGLDGEQAVSVAEQGKLPLRDALSRHYEIARPSRETLSLIAGQPGNGALQQRLAQGETLKSWLWGRQLADVLAEFSWRGEATTLLASLKRLQPRFYSIASSPLAHPGEIQLTVATVRYGQRKGVASAWLADLAPGDAVAVFVQPTRHFLLPEAGDAPLVMIGPGTGIAPFRGFLHHRRLRGDSGKNWLFFGEQHQHSEFYYRGELEQMRQSGLLTRLSLAFSRDQPQKIYVQDRLREEGETLWRWLQEGARLYLCGDASRMAKDVETALRDIACQHGGMNAQQAAGWLQQLAQEKRFLRDVY